MQLALSTTPITNKQLAILQKKGYMENSNSRASWWKYGIGLAIVGLLLFFFLGWNKQSNQPTSLYDQFYKTPILNLTDKPNTKFCNRSAIKELVNNQRYQKLWDQLEDCLAENPKDPVILKTKIIALLEANQLQMARATLIKLIAHESYLSEAIWLTALSWVKEGDHQKAIRVLAQLPEDSDYLGRAKLLIKTLKENKKKVSNSGAN